MDFVVVPERTALINVDLQNTFVEGLPEANSLLDRINRLAVACRDAGIAVIHTRHVVRADLSDAGVIGGKSRRLRKGLLTDGAPSAELHPSLIVEPTDHRLDKPRFGAFHGSDLGEILRRRGVDTLIISGIATDVCCDTTAREAHARDFRVFFLSDGTATASGSAAQQSTLEFLDDRFAQVISVSDMLEKIVRSTTKPAP